MAKKLIIMALGAAFLFSACEVNEPIYDTSHPEQGQIIKLTTDWTAIGTGISIPPTYTVKVGGYSAQLTGQSNTIDNLFASGTYSVSIYNTADHVTVSGTAATANYTSGFPGWLFTSVTSLTIEKDADHEFIAVMNQQVRELNLVIEPTGSTIDKIASLSATLSGVASTVDFANNTHSNAVSIAPAFIKQADGKYKATVSLLGIIGQEQKLSLTVTFANNSPAPITQEMNIHTQLGNFNADKKTPLTLGAQTVETTSETGFTATITDWTKVTGGTGTAN